MLSGDFMALFNIKFYSHVTHIPQNAVVFLPDRRKFDGNSDLKVLWLLHGMCAVASDWVQLTRITEYAQEAGIAVVMPDCGNSYYADMRHGAKYETYFVNELMPNVNAWFGFSAKKSKNAVAGASMGAFAAVKLALKTGLFGAAGSLSAPMDLHTAVSSLTDKFKDCRQKFFSLAYGDLDRFERCDDNVVNLLPRAKDLPMFLYCGRLDALYKINCNMYKKFLDSGAEVVFCEDDGDHTWKSWDARLPDMINFLSAKLD